MDKELNSSYVKRSLKDYSMSFKLEVVREVETGELSATAATNYLQLLWGN
ncbi:hypothetical protein JCM30204_30810 [Dysgonomonas termitidis]|jgi:hypothetical protein